MVGLCEGGNEPPGSLKASKLVHNKPETRIGTKTKTQEDRDITYALFCSVLCIMEQVVFDEIQIFSVEENPHVYDKRRASYKDDKMKENTWFSISASLNTDPFIGKNIHHESARQHRLMAYEFSGLQSCSVLFVNDVPYSDLLTFYNITSNLPYCTFHQFFLLKLQLHPVKFLRTQIVYTGIFQSDVSPTMKLLAKLHISIGMFQRYISPTIKFQRQEHLYKGIVQRVYNTNLPVNKNVYFNPHYPFLTYTTSALNGSNVPFNVMRLKH
ncbi:hypothetical protein ANN_17946 [Periplaneta americana]|uniref:MADF domain-containing protein n=1 Tax=Periplaneta americana TaxID=6978 RepID=A0ABQ8SNL8_PERAM|nr:hypothetical protein ANN_17946 [Periplaneta americana]